MKVLLTGATGYTGSAVADALVASAREVTGPVRSSEASASLRERNINAHPGDLNDSRSLTLAARRPDAVIHTAIAESPDAPQVYKTAVETILKALEETGKPFHLHERHSFSIRREGKRVRRG